MRGWTQERAAGELEPYIGERWSKATWSSAERSVDGQRVRQFTADDIHAFARAFGLPMTFFLAPPPWSGDEIGHAAGGKTDSRAGYLDQLFDLPEDAADRLLNEVVEMSADTTLALRRWRANLNAMVDKRQRQVDALLAVREEDQS